ncbi:MAG: T9SS type A sorting domain-containing protein [Bacteroidales bacterium]|nr:T9SS type A sorting domain-containing protein [Bacteroidales bacterium]
MDSLENFSKLAGIDFSKGELDNPIPPGWEFFTSDKVHIISVFTSANPNLCGIPMEPGDYIGLFYMNDNGEETCGGCAQWTGTENVPLIAYGDDNYTTIKDGFAQGETLLWRVYLYSMNNEIFSATPVYDPAWQSTNKFGSGGLSIVWELNYFYPNNIIIPQGWSGLSSYTKARSFPPIIYNVLSPISNELIIIQDMTKMYYPEAGINTMFVWTNGKGYKIKLSEEAVFPMMGCPVDNPTVSLTATWNLLPVLSRCNVLASQLFAPILSKIIVVKEIAGNRVFWPAMGIETLQVLEPGKAYYMAVTSSTSVTYQDCQSFKEEIVPQESEMQNLTTWNDPVKTGFTHNIAFYPDALADLHQDDFIGAFTSDGYCAGLVQINDISKNQAITVYGDDITTPEIDGIAEGEEITFKVFKSNNGEEINVRPEYDLNYPSSNGLFYDNGLSVVNTLKLSSTGISEMDCGISIFPNPTNDMVELRKENAENSTITIQTVNGRMLMQKQITGNTQLNLSDYSKGIYVIIIENSNSRNIQKLVIK